MKKLLELQAKLVKAKEALSKASFAAPAAPPSSGDDGKKPKMSVKYSKDGGDKHNWSVHLDGKAIGMLHHSGESGDEVGGAVPDKHMDSAAKLANADYKKRTSLKKSLEDINDNMDRLTKSLLGDMNPVQKMDDQGGMVAGNTSPDVNMAKEEGKKEALAHDKAQSHYAKNVHQSWDPQGKDYDNMADSIGDHGAHLQETGKHLPIDKKYLQPKPMAKEEEIKGCEDRFKAKKIMEDEMDEHNEKKHGEKKDTDSVKKYESDPEKGMPQNPKTRKEKGLKYNEKSPSKNEGKPDHKITGDFEEYKVGGKAKHMIKFEKNGQWSMHKAVNSEQFGSANTRENAPTVEGGAKDRKYQGGDPRHDTENKTRNGQERMIVDPDNKKKGLTVGSSAKRERTKAADGERKSTTTMNGKKTKWNN